MRALLAIALCACRAGGTFACERDSQCTGAGALGTCEPSGFCAFDDPSCVASGKRYDPYAGDGLANVCVGDEPGDARVDTPVTQGAPLHLAPADGMAGSGDFALANAMIDTSALTVSVALPAGVTFDQRPQLGGGPDLAVLHVHGLNLGGTVLVTGARPLVIVAGAGVTIDGVLDASGRASVAGPGAASTGAGGDGAHLAAYSDSGGGGGGFATDGGAGGAVGTGCTVIAGSAGAMQGNATITTLVGGSPGGRGSGASCPLNSGGGGGGALQISSAVSIAVNGGGQILAGGGGGTGGTDCGPDDGNSGAGGGAGGAIVLQAPSIINGGMIAANGGGGGGSGTGAGGSGMPGQDALASTAVALGGAGVGASGIAGGAGASASAAAQPGMTNTCGNNAGGGGGAVGRIATSTGYVDNGVTSPAATASLAL